MMASSAKSPSSSPSSSSSSSSSSSHFIRSPGWDALFIFSGLWAPLLSLGVFAVVQALAPTPLAIDAPGYDVRSFAMLYLPLAIAHRLSTPWAVLATPILRDELRKDRRRYLHVPLLILLGCVALSLLFVFHQSMPMPSAHAQLWAFFALAYVMVLWERWHFCAQEFGVLSLYRMRAGQFAPEDKRFDRIYTVVLMLGVNMVLFLCFGFEDERDVLLHGTALGAYRGDLLQPVGLCAFVVGMALVAFALVRELRHPRRSLPKLAFYALVGSHTLVLYLFPRQLGLFFLSYVVHHWVVSVGLFGQITLAAQSGASLASRAWSLSWRFGPVLAVTVLFYLAFGVLDKAGNLSPLPEVSIFGGASVGAKLLAGTVIGLFFALNYLHYYYDRVFYSFTNPAVRARVAPLLLNRQAARPGAPQQSAPSPQSARASSPARMPSVRPSASP